MLNAGRTAYGVVRSLVGATSEVVVVDHVKSSLRFSKLVDKFVLLPNPSDPSTDHDALVEDLISIRGSGEKMVIACCKDNWVTLICRYQMRLRMHFDFTSETRDEVLGRVSDKSGLATFAREKGILTPRSAVSLAEIQDLEPPLIVKPSQKHTVGLDIEDRAFRLKVCNSKEEATAAANSLQRLGSNFVVQELVGGAQPRLHTVGIVAKNGQVVVSATAQKLRQFPPRFGECTLGATTDNRLLENVAAHIIQTTGLSGVAQLEFIEHSGDYYLIEINVRFWSWHEIHVASGANIASAAAAVAQGVSRSSIAMRPQKRSVSWQFFAMDFLWSALISRTVSPVTVARDFLRCDTEAFYRRNDWRVFFHHFISSIPYFLRVWRSERVRGRRFDGA